jgi:hypothetical protein
MQKSQNKNNHSSGYRPHRPGKYKVGTMQKVQLRQMQRNKRHCTPSFSLTWPYLSGNILNLRTQIHCTTTMCHYFSQLKLTVAVYIV